MKEFAALKELIKECMFMKNIKTKEELMEFIKTSEYWADTWAVSTLERVLNIKIVIFSEEYYRANDINSVLNCGQLNDSELETRGSFSPEFYILTSYSGDHYQLITYKDKNIFKFKEVPYDVKILIVNKCIEKDAGPYYLIQDMRNFKVNLGLAANVGEPTIPEQEETLLDKDLYDNSIIFKFNSESSNLKAPGKGSGEKIPAKKQFEFAELGEIADWRKKLDDKWSAPFTLNGHRWQSVQHYYIGSQYKKGFPDFYLQFSLDSDSEISKDLKMAKMAIESKTGKMKNKVVRPPQVKPDADFFEISREPRSISERRIALEAKFEQNPELKRILLLTKKAKLIHNLKGEEPEIDGMLMNLRKRLQVTST